MKIFSGIQPTGALHIGNYLGMLKQSVELQKEGGCIYCVVDLHAMTIPYDPKQMQKNILDVTVCYLAAGIDPAKSILFIQSKVPEHTELAWILNTVTPISDLMRMTQYKDKSNQFKEEIGAGLLNYPVLMAADILLYKTQVVPVGKDQEQHVELARTIARKFNKKFGQTFIEPKVKLAKEGAKIMSLTNPKKKMSKSIPAGCLYLFDEPEVIRKKIMSSVTDLEKQVKYDLIKKPGISNLLTIYSLFSGKPIKDIEKKFKDQGYAKFKEKLADLLIKELEPLRKKRKELLSRQVYIEEILEQGARKAKTIAQETMAEVKKKTGLI
ncbi:MAG: tryptophan--tRNA ligase [Parcubacteria group bacterium CG10_big_fil_rev_8_21_14_0_10_35_15]|nr:MAG: tryptophan--tRNA ligase [Parcubacteria group bacterium CG10_big_fil_rev_8_21_14_0_10_35_15]